MKFILTIALIFNQTLIAQTHHEFWSKLNFKSGITERWSWGMDYQFRTQSDYRKSRINPFHNKLAGSARVWAYYKIDKKWDVFVSPIALFRNYDFVAQSNELKQTDEWRYSAGFFHTYKNRGLELKGRVMGEHRHFISGNQTTIDRLRIQLNFSHNLKEFKSFSMDGLIMEEYHYRINRGFEGTDQNRLYAGFRGKTKKFEVTLGYQWTRQYIAIQYTERLQTHLSLNIHI